ncbi:MAG TPA: SRPBCC family protein [Mycobacterium sp.]
MQGNTVSVERVIKAPAREIFALLADAGRHSSFDGSGTVDHAIAHARSSQGSADSIPLELGTKFSMKMRGRPETLFMPYTMSNKVIEFEPDRRIAWQPTRLGGLIGGRIWRYELTPTQDGTLVRETWDVSKDRQRPMLKMGAMPRQAEDGMRATLARIAALVET